MSAPSPDLDLTVALEPGRPAVLEVDPADLGATGWATAHRDTLRRLVAAHGALVVRGLGLTGADQVGALFRALGSELMGDQEAFAQRRQHEAGVFSSAAWPDHQQMCMHHELSYRLTVPSLAMFACLTAPDEGGVTGLADAGAVLDALPPDLVARFEQTGWLLARTFGGDIGPSVADAFGTEDRAAVDAYCRDNAIEAQWQDTGELRTRQRRPAVITHPVTGRRTWFNQVAFLSEWTIDPEIREFLVDMYGSDGLPFTTAYGDGTPLDAETIELLNQTYESLTVREPWVAGDLMLVDNLATAHSREPFSGPREVLVALTDPVRLDTLAASGGPA